jgi:hypothetical protein
MTNNEYLKEFVPYPLALRLKKLGFNEPCIGMYCKGVFYQLYRDMGNHIPNDVYREVDAPTFSQAFRWFRKEYAMFHNIDRIFLDEFGYTISNEKDEPLNFFDFNSWEEAELNCLEKLIEITEYKLNVKLKGYDI